MTEPMSNRDVFFSGLVKAFEEKFHFDVLLKPGDKGDAIPAHKVVLAARSKVLRNILDSDECKASVIESLTFSELNYKELETFVEFLYSGTLLEGKLKQHAKTLYVAADKYDIPYLEELCRHYLVSSINSSNALDVFELADIPSDKTLRDTVLDFIVGHFEEIASLDVYEWFVQRHPNLAVQITRQFLTKIKADKKADSRIYVRRYPRPEWDWP